MTLADIMRSVIQGAPDGALLEAALRSLGGDEIRPLEALDREERASLVARLMAALRERREVGDRDLARLELQLMRAVNVMPRGERTVELNDEAAGAALHKLARYYSVCIGMDWARASALQLALTEFCREVAGRGGLELSMGMTGLTQLTIQLRLDIGYDLVVFSIEAREPWTLPLCEASASVSTSRMPDGGRLSFVIDSERRARQPSVASV